MSIDLKEEVRRALAAEWPAFAANHPRLAAALDETVLVPSAMQSLGDDPEYVEAMATAAAVGAGAEVVADVVARFVRGWLRRLV
jgi:hypothetical protein